MQLSEFRFLSGPNMIASRSGALFVFGALDLQARLDAQRLQVWLSPLVGLPLPPDLPWQEPFSRLAPALLLAFTSFSRLHGAHTRSWPVGAAGLAIWLPVDDRASAELAAALLCALVSAVAQGGGPAAGVGPGADGAAADAVVGAELNRLWRELYARRWNQTHAHLARAAERLAVPWDRFDRGGQQILQLGQGRRRRLFHETTTDRAPVLSLGCRNKALLHELLDGRGIPLPRQRRVTALEEAQAAAAAIGWPVVLKPERGGKGQRVWVGLADAAALERAWHANGGGTADPQLVQQQLHGHDHRLLVSGGSLLAVAQRLPAMVVGDGHHGLRQLIAALNADPRRGVGYERLMNRVPVDARLFALLSEQGLDLESVPGAGVCVQLSRTANISQGGTAVDRTDRIHPDNRRLAEDVALLLGADVVGLDVMTADISRSWRDGGLFLLEANLSPGLRPHLLADPHCEIAERLVSQWMGSAEASRIPVALVTGSAGKTTTTRLLSHLLSSEGQVVASVTSTGVQVGDQVLAAGDHAGGGAVRHCLRDPRVDVVVGEVARGGLLKSGLKIAEADVCAVLNVLDNHIGIDGLRDRGDLARVKSIVARAARSLLVLNADDPLVLSMRPQPAGDAASGSAQAGAQAMAPALALVSRAPGCAAWQAHRAAGHLAALYSFDPQADLEIWQEGGLLLSFPLRAIPAAEEGAVGSLAVTAAFAALMALGLGLSAETIASRLRSFGEQPQHRLGRFQPLVDHPFQVILAWADGAQAVASLSSYALRATREKAARKVLLLTCEDNRPDAYIRRCGEAAWGFDRVICCSARERRNRAVGDVAALLAEGVGRLTTPRPEILLAETEEDGLPLLAAGLQSGDFAVICSFETLWLPAALQQALHAHSPVFRQAS